MNVSYPYRVEQEGSAYLVQFIDLEDAFTEGETLDEAHYNAAEVLSLVVQGRIEDSFDIPRPSNATGKNIHRAQPEPDLQVALLVHWSMEDTHTSIADLARTLKSSWASTQRLEKPGNNPTLKKLRDVAAGLGKRLVVSFE